MSDQPGQARGTNPVTDEEHAATSSGRFGRRALMLGAAATGAGVAASVAGGGIADAAPSAAHPVLLGKFNSAHATTEVSTNKGIGLKGQTSANGPSGVAGVAGIDTSSAGTQGVFGHSVHGQGVLGTSQNGTGITGLTSTAGKSGVAGIDRSTAGARGVFAQSPHGDALFATSPNGTALRGESAHGLALFAQGKAKFAHSGVATVASGHTSVTVSVPGIAASDIVLATIQNPHPPLAVAGAQASSGSLTITLTGTAGRSIPVGWLVIA